MTLTESAPDGLVRRKALSTRGMLLAMLGDHAAALASLEAVRDLIQPDEDPRAIAIAWGNLAYCHLDEAWSLPPEAPRRAVLAAQGLPDSVEAARLSVEAGLSLYEGFAAISAGGCLAMLGRLDESAEMLGRALALTQGMPSMEADAQLLRAWVWRMQGQPVEAAEALDRAEALCQDGHLPITLGRLLDERLHLAQSHGDGAAQLAAALKALHHWKHIDATRRHTVARHAALFAEAERARREAEAWARAARQDPLTGTLNRRGLDDARDALEGRASSLIILDVDHFKRINDRLGHAVGDAVLVHLAGLLRDQFRRQDLIARMGGEEFLVVLPEAGRALSRQRAEQLRQRVETANWSVHHPDLHVTISLGVSGCRAEGDFDEALAAADAALYRAKAAGRNCFAEAAD
jgi:diguanylate cyclase (GGDEF)-like protein